MAQSISPCSRLPYLTPDNKPPDGGDLGSGEPQGRQELSLLDKVRLNLDFTKHVELTPRQSTNSADTEVGEAKSEASSPRTPLTSQLWEGANALRETIIGKTAIEILGGEIPDDLWIEQNQESGVHELQLDSRGHNSGADEEVKMIKGNIDQTGRGIASKNPSDVSHPVDGDHQTWSQWAAEKAIAAEHAAEQSAIKVKDSAVSTVKYVTDAAASKLSNIAEPATSSTSKYANVANGDKTMSVQDLVDQYSTIRTPEVGQKSANKGVTARSRNLAENLRQNAISAFTPDDGDKELAETITASLSSLPTLLKETVWISSSGQRQETSLGGMPTLTNSNLAPASGLEFKTAGAASSAAGARSLQVQHQKVEPKPDEETLDSIRPDKLMELWTIGNGTLDCTVNNASLDSENFLSPKSPKTPGSAFSPGAMMHTNVKAEAIAEAHRSRVTTEANAYVEAELRKAEAHRQKMHARAESHRLQEESRATDNLRKEELRAELMIQNAEAKAELLLAEAKSKSASIRAIAEEEYAKNMADSKTKAERWLAEIEETKQKEIAELYDRVETMILMREFPLPRTQPKKESVVKKVKEKVMSHIRGY